MAQNMEPKKLVMTVKIVVKHGKKEKGGSPYRRWRIT
jgi:hypothetical protein